MRLEYILRKAADKAEEEEMNMTNKVCNLMGFVVLNILGENSPSYKITVEQIPYIPKKTNGKNNKS